MKEGKLETEFALEEEKRSFVQVKQLEVGKEVGPQRGLCLCL
jgi:hypothetical protein